MELKVNGKGVIIDNPEVMLSNLLEHLAISTSGIATAVNNKVISRKEWPHTVLKNGDSIIVINAVCGG